MSAPAHSHSREGLSAAEKWVILGFALSWALFFVLPVFLAHRVMYVPEQIPIAGRPWIGGDLKMQYDAVREWLLLGRSWDRMFPTGSAVLFAPLTMLPFLAAYRVLTLITLACYALTAVVLPARTHRATGLSPLLVLVAVTGLTSYGLLFELERGQWNVIALSLALASIRLFGKGGRWRIAAYALLTVAVQLKLWPLIFILMLVEGRESWTSIFTRWGGITAANVGLLLALGLRGFNGVSGFVAQHFADPRPTVETHSVFNFAHYSSSLYGGWPPAVTLALEGALLALVLGCLLTIVFVGRSRGERGWNPYLLLACAVGACLIPPLSNDYKLSILAIPVAFLLGGPLPDPHQGGGRRAWTFAATMLTFSFAYSSTLYSYAYKPPLIGSNAPFLLVMLLAATILYVRFSGGQEVGGRGEERESHPSAIVPPTVAAGETASTPSCGRLAGGTIDAHG